METEVVALRIVQGIGVIVALLGIWFIGRLIRNHFRPLEVTSLGISQPGSDSDPKPELNKK